MRILMLAQFYPPLIGGEERHVRDLSLELTARGHAVAVATLWQEDLPTFECDQGIHVYRIRGSLQRLPVLFSDNVRRHAPPFTDPQVLWSLRRIILQERPHVVHAHNWMVHSFTPLKAWSKAKLVVTLHDCSLICAKQDMVYLRAVCTGPGLMKCLDCSTKHYGVSKGVPITLANWMWGKVESQTVDMFLPVSQSVASATRLAEYKMPYRVIPNFVSDTLDKLQDDADPLLDRLPKGEYLLFVGDMGRGKGEEVLLQAHARMENPKVPLVLIGRSANDTLANRPLNVVVLPSWPHASIMQAWSRCTIAVVPSTSFDSCPTVTLEAMAMGRPVVASHIGGLPDIVVDGETGLLVPPGDGLVLQQAIECLLADPALRERMGARARQRVVQFQASSVVPRIEEVYHEVLLS